MYQLKNKVIVVSGSTGVLGNSLVDSLAEEKAFLILLGRNNKLLQKKINELNNKTIAEYFVVDVLNKSDLERVSLKINDRYFFKTFLSIFEHITRISLSAPRASRLLSQAEIKIIKRKKNIHI